MKTTGAQLITQLLERQGITIVPGIPGGANLPLYDALRAQRHPPRAGAPRTGRGLHRAGHGARHAASRPCASAHRAPAPPTC